MPVPRDDVRIEEIADPARVAEASHLFDDPLDPAATTAYLADPRHLLLLAYVDDRPVGMLTAVEHLHPDKAAHGQEEITEALRDAAALEATITAGDTFVSIRFGFADEVAVQWLPRAETQVELIEALRESVMALGRFVQRAANAYLGTRPEGTITVE